MKTQVIQLNQFDDSISLKDKINWSKATRILVVWPDVGRIMLTRVDLELILRQADMLGAQLAFVSDDLQLLELCKARGIQVFESIPEAYKKPWRRPKKIRVKNLFENQESRASYLHAGRQRKNYHQTKMYNISRVAFFILAIISVSGLVLSFIPSAKVDVQVLPQKESISLIVRANPSITSVNLTGAIPARLNTITLEGSLEEKSSGYVRIPAKYAVGKLQFRNLTSTEIVIPAGTIVRTENEPIVRFTTEEELNLAGDLNAIAETAAISLVGGVIGNVAPGSISAIEGLIGGSVAVENTSSFSGGTDIKTLSPSQQDIAQARQKLQMDLKKKALQSFMNNTSGVFYWVEDTLTMEQIEYETQFPETGLPGERFTYQTGITYSIWSIDEADLIELLRKTNESILAEAGQADFEKIQFSLDKTPSVDQNKDLMMQLTAFIDIKPRIDPIHISQTLSGKTIREARDTLENDLPFVQVGEISTYPTFLTRLPLFPMRIKVDING